MRLLTPAKIHVLAYSHKSQLEYIEYITDRSLYYTVLDTTYRSILIGYILKLCIQKRWAACISDINFASIKVKALLERSFRGFQSSLIN